MLSSNQLRSYAFNDGKLIPIHAKMIQSQVSYNNNNMLFHLRPASIEDQSNNDVKQKSNNETMDQVQQQQSLMDIVEKPLCNSNANNDVENRDNNNSFLSELISTGKNYAAGHHNRKLLRFT